MPSKRQKPTSLALLPFIPPTLTTVATLFPLHTRHLQLRGNILLISRKPLTQTIPSSTTTLPIFPCTNLKQISGTTLILEKHRLTFRTSHQAHLFKTAINTARHARRSYETLSEIGSGASGTVYLVRREASYYAMKTIPKWDAFYSDNHLQRIISERLALAQTRASPFIVSLHDAFETSTHLCLVTELASYGDLFTFVKSTPNKRLPENVARSLFVEALLGLEDLHRSGYLYRDMKLNNLLVTKNGHVRLADMGLAKKVSMSSIDSSVSSSSESDDDEGQVRLLGRTKSFVGTRRYMSPEHLVAGHGSKSSSGYGAEADIWALGVVLYVMLTGRYPFGNGVSSGNAARLFMAIKNDQLMFPEWVGEEARALLEGMLERDWLERFDISMIKSHPWLRNVNWAQVRRRAADDTPVEEVVAIAGGVDLVEDSDKSVDKSVEFSDVSDDDLCAKRKDVSQLLGFGFMG